MGNPGSLEGEHKYSLGMENGKIPVKDLLWDSRVPREVEKVKQQCWSPIWRHFREVWGQPETWAWNAWGGSGCDSGRWGGDLPSEQPKVRTVSPDVLSSIQLPLGGIIPIPTSDLLFNRMMSILSKNSRLRACSIFKETPDKLEENINVCIKKINSKLAWHRSVISLF